MRQSGAARRWLRYAAIAVLVTLGVVGAGWPFLPEEGRRGFLLAGAIALAVQLPAFGLLVTREVGTPGYLAAWVGGSFLRLLVVVVAAVWVARSEAVDTASALLALVGLLFVLLLLEPWAAREGKTRDRSNGTERE